MRSAEGVETAEVAELLGQLGVSQLPEYLIARPSRLVELRQALKHRLPAAL